MSKLTRIQVIKPSTAIEKIFWSHSENMIRAFRKQTHPNAFKEQLRNPINKDDTN